MKLDVSIQPINIGEECDDSQIREILRGWLKNKKETTDDIQRSLDFIELLSWLTDRCEQYTLSNSANFEHLLENIENKREYMERVKLL